MLKSSLSYMYNPDADEDCTASHDVHPEHPLLKRIHFGEVDSIEACLCHGRDDPEMDLESVLPSFRGRREGTCQWDFPSHSQE